MRPHADGVLAIRPARAADRDAVFEFCARGAPTGDHIPAVWDAWLESAQGVLLVATYDGQPAGIAHVQLVAEEEAWLEGVRVDPLLRRQGIGRVLTSHALVNARGMGASVTRLMTGASNLAAQQLYARFGFERVAELARYAAPPAMSEHGVTPRLPAPAELEHVWAWLEQSNLTPFNGGLEILHWRARALTEPQLREYLQAGHVAVLEAWGTIQALAVAVPEVPPGSDLPHLRVRYLDGTADGIGRLALALRERAAARALAGVRLWLPDLLILQDAMSGAGYARQGVELLCARAL